MFTIFGTLLHVRIEETINRVTLKYNNKNNNRFRYEGIIIPGKVL